MELFTKLFATWLVFVYHCFDRIVLSGYLMGLQRPGRVVFWLRHVLGVDAITKDLLSRRTQDYISWVGSFARNRHIPVEWAERDVRKEEYVLPLLMTRGNGANSGAIGGDQGATGSAHGLRIPRAAFPLISGCL